MPIEVKPTNGKSKSLRTLIQSEKYSDIAFGVELIDGNIGCSEISTRFRISAHSF